MTEKISEFHAHVYFGPETKDEAVRLCEAAQSRFAGVTMGRIHERPVGPHPQWSCQLAFGPELFGEVVPWLALNRGRTVVFLHPETGDGLKDHSAHAMWIGPSDQLDLSNFNEAD